MIALISSLETHKDSGFNFFFFILEFKEDTNVIETRIQILVGSLGRQFRELIY